MKGRSKRTKYPKKDRATLKFLTIIKRALREDIGRGDITTDAIVLENDRALGVIFAKEEGILCGIDIAQNVFEQLDPAIDFQKQMNDGSTLSRGDTIAILIGKASTCLKAERTALNFLQHLSGIATRTREFVNVAGDKIRILDTRKTMPGLRIMEKYAVRTGGGFNHRSGLYDRIMIKDNHIQIAGDITEAVKRVRRRRKQFIEVEVKTMSEVKEALALEVDRIMLDNMNVNQITRAVNLVRTTAATTEIEISGGVDMTNIAQLASCGADYISIGALTHSAKALDIALKLKPLGPKAI
ncbi:MAG: carboxylating nicotinate-nucleotide diphosphorylase [candidate division WOR-3 bacterium]|nr:MAG: carboxylating nicotinate-nucleotide diphosphorylase [candidate division WOR-3 bacterium]